MKGRKGEKRSVRQGEGKKEEKKKYGKKKRRKGKRETCQPLPEKKKSIGEP